MSERHRQFQAPHAQPDVNIAADGTFEGYASLFNREDLGHDVVLPGAFRETLARRGAAGVKMLFQHNPAEPIGVWDTLVEDARGLFVRGRLMPDVARSREVLSLMRAGAIDGLSIGFQAVKARRDRARGVRNIEKIDLWEISVVTFPMLPEARVFAVSPKHQVPASLASRNVASHCAATDIQAAAARMRHRLDRHSRELARFDPHVLPEASALASQLAGERVLVNLMRLAALEQKRFNPGQLRVPAGETGGGQWTDGDGSTPDAFDDAAIESGDPADETDDDLTWTETDRETLLHLAASSGKPLPPGAIRSLYRDSTGHHLLPLAEVQLRSNILSPDAVDILSRRTLGSSGQLKDQSDPANPHRGRSAEHRAYSAGVNELTDRFIKDNGIDKANPMTREQAVRLGDAIDNSRDPRIRSFNDAVKSYIGQRSGRRGSGRSGSRGGGRGHE